jgi:hypothetical protein
MANLHNFHAFFIWKKYEPFYPYRMCRMQLLCMAFQVWEVQAMYQCYTLDPSSSQNAILCCHYPMCCPMGHLINYRKRWILEFLKLLGYRLSRLPAEPKKKKKKKKENCSDINCPPIKCVYQAFIIQNLDNLTLELGMKVCDI